MTYLQFSEALTQVSLGLAALTVLLSLASFVFRERRLVVASRRALVAGGLTTLGAAAGLVAAFFDGAYELKYVFSYSERALAWPFKVAGLWAGLDGSILFWSMILGVIGIVLARGFAKEGDEPSRRRLEPYVYVVYGTVQLFFLVVIARVASPFEPLDHGFIAGMSNAGLPVTAGRPGDGSGLNPLLENYWMLIHPPSVYLGFILYTVPFAFGLAALLAGEFSPWWIRATRRWTMAAWILNTNGVVLGGLWAYEVLGWGGYWAWDPVENSSLLPWLAGTAFLHSVMVQERRDMLRVWNSVLICTTFVLSLFGTYLTRSGIVSSVHAFASGAVGDWFLGFLLLVIFVSIFLVVLRARELRSHNTIDTLMSREAVFLLNNFVLLAIAAAVVLLTLWPKISFEFMREAITVGVPTYNLVATPFFVLLLALTAIGPSMGWVRTSVGSLAKNLVLPAAVSLPMAVITQWVAYEVVRGGDQDDPLTWAQHVYPTFAVVFLSWLIVTALTWEVLRTVSNASHGSGRPWFGSFLRLVTMHNRRYGGYVVHAGLAFLAMGVVLSSMYKLTNEVRVAEGSSARFGPYEMRVRDVERDVPVSAYLSTRVHLDVFRDGVEVASLSPEKRHYPRTGFRTEPRDTTEPSIDKSLGQDFYVFFARAQDDGALWFTVFRNPMINLVWMGWVVMIAGGIWAALPFGKKRVGLAG